MTFMDILNGTFVPPPVKGTRRFYMDGHKESDKYRPTGDVAKAISKRKQSASESDRRIVEFVEKNPASTRAQIANGLGMKQSTVAQRIVMLVYRDILKSESRCMSKTGGAQTYFYWKNRRG